MNIHPIFVHFPIALLTVYAILECCRVKKFLVNKSFFGIKAFLAIVGSLSTLAALYTGGLAEDIARANVKIRPVIELHSTFAGWTTFVFAVIACSYLVIVLENWSPLRNKRFWSVLVKIAHIIQTPWLIIILAIVGLVLITITGALGGLIVYGSSTDPFISLVAKIFFPNM